MHTLAPIALLLAAGLASAGDDLPPRAVATWEAMSEVQSLEARFRQVRHSTLLTAPLESEGVLRFRRPDALAWVVTAPSRSTMVVRGSTVGMAYPDLGVQEELDLSSDPDTARLVGGMLVWLTGDLEAVSRDYRVTWEDVEERGVATLVPQDQIMAGLIAQMILTIGGEPPRVESVVLVEPDADRVEIHLHDVKVDTALSDEAFSLEGAAR